MRAYLKRYDAEFREQAVGLLQRTDRSLIEVATSLGIPMGTLYGWYRRDMARRRGKPKAIAGGTTTAASPQETVQQQLQRLERENAALRKKVEALELDRDILKKAAAFFAKESE
jgi:transposase